MSISMKFRNIAGRGIFGESKVKGKLPMTGKYMAYVGSYSYTGRQRESLYMMWMLRLENSSTAAKWRSIILPYLKASQNGQIPLLHRR